MRFSIVIPIYNVEAYLERCVLSVINQSFDDIEIILVDDESPDNCPSLCDKYALQDKRIKVVHKKNGGLSDARNAGISVSSGDYIIFLDADDYIDEKTCELFYKYTVEKYDIIIGNAIVHGGKAYLNHDTEYGKYTGLKYLKKSFRNNYVPMAAWLNIYRTDFLKDNHLYFKKGILHEDEEFTPRAFIKADSVMQTDIDFYHYVIREGSITTKKDKKKNITDFYSTCKELEKMYRQIEDKELRKALLNSLVSKYLTLYVTANAYEYGKDFYHKFFIYKNARTLKTRIQSIVYCISPRGYCKLVNYKRRENNG